MKSLWDSGYLRDLSFEVNGNSITLDMSTYLPPDTSVGAAQGCSICTLTARVWGAQGKNSVSTVNVGKECQGNEYSSVARLFFSCFWQNWPEIVWKTQPSTRGKGFGLGHHGSARLVSSPETPPVGTGNTNPGKASVEMEWEQGSSPVWWKVIFWLLSRETRRITTQRRKVCCSW